MTKSKRFGTGTLPATTIRPWQPSYASLLVAGAIMGAIVVTVFLAFPWAQWIADAQFALALAGG